MPSAIAWPLIIAERPFSARVYGKDWFGVLNVTVIGPSVSTEAMVATRLLAVVSSRVAARSKLALTSSESKPLTSWNVTASRSVIAIDKPSSLICQSVAGSPSGSRSAFSRISCSYTGER